MVSFEEHIKKILMKFIHFFLLLPMPFVVYVRNLCLTKDLEDFLL